MGCLFVDVRSVFVSMHFSQQYYFSQHFLMDLFLFHSFLYSDISFFLEDTNHHLRISNHLLYSTLLVLSSLSSSRKISSSNRLPKTFRMMEGESVSDFSKIYGEDVELWFITAPVSFDPQVSFLVYNASVVYPVCCSEMLRQQIYFCEHF